MKKKINEIIVIIIIFSVGLTIGKLLNWGYFELSNEISIIDALTFFTTIGLAIYIAKILEKEVQDTRIEKELYIAKISELESLLLRIEGLVEDKDISINMVISRIHSCRVKKGVIFKHIRNNFKKINSEEVSVFEKEITKRINSLKRLLTETPIIPNNSPELSVKNGYATYATNRIIKIDTEINAINEHLFKLKIKINSL
jgi:hypothetical protein